jgi:Fe-S-cluster containining protein
MTETIHPPFFKQLSTLYTRMDTAWTAAAAHYGFHCQGCVDNCCETEFHHHTHIEKHYLLAGLKTLDPGTAEKIRTRAATVCEQREDARKTGATARVMCPLNSQGLCQLYDFRPMICRLHGIPHELQRPGAPAIQGPGCETGDPLFSAASYLKFDRTPFYADMASIEMAYRTAIENPGKIRETIAEMLMN